MIVQHMPQGSEEWFEARRGRPTASNFDRIVTSVKGDLSKSCRDYIAELIGEIGTPDRSLVPEKYISPAMVAGIQMEPEARKWYCFHRDIEVQQVGLIITEDGRFGASPDALVGEDGLLELKCPQPKAHVNYLLDGKLPDNYRQQVHGQLWVSGRKWVDFCSYCHGFDPLLVRVEPDAYTEKLGAALNEFWNLYAEAFVNTFPSRGPLKLAA